MYGPKRKTWFLIADGAKARLFESLGRSRAWKLINEWEEANARSPSRELGDDRPTRGRKSGSGGGYAVDTLSEHDKAEELFVRERAGFINDAAIAGEFDQFVLTAPPAALGVFRKCLSAEVVGKYISVLDKDLTNVPENELSEYFKNNIAHW